MFQFPRFALVRKRVTELAPCRVAPFGHLGINACVPLPQAYRSLPRPSSPPCAQASPTCLHSLDYNNLWFKQSVLRSSNYIPLSSEQSKTNSIEIESCSIRILKSAIYHAFRCQIASTLIVRQPPEGGHRRAASSRN